MIDIPLFLVFSTLVFFNGSLFFYLSIFTLIHLLRSLFFSRTTLYHSSSSFTNSIIASCPSFQTGYKPTFWLYNGFIQVLFEATFGNLIKYDFLCSQIDYKREIIHHPDGGVLAIDWAGPKASQSKKILLIAPGITGDSYVQYVRHLGHDAIASRYTIGVLIGRGLSGLPIKTPVLHNACSFDDFGYLIEKVRKRYPKTFLVGLGISMGSGVLLKYVTQTGENCSLDAIASVATSFNHNLSARALDEFWPHFGIPGKGLLKIVQNYLIEIEHHLLNWPEFLEDREVFLHHGKKVQSFYDFDDKITARLSGFSGAEEYYRNGSTHEDIDKVKIPLFALNSLDDPIITAKGIPIQSFVEHKNTILMTTSNGGHVGWFTGFLKVKRWFQVPCLEFFEAVRIFKLKIKNN